MTKDRTGDRNQGKILVKLISSHTHVFSLTEQYWTPRERSGAIRAWCKRVRQSEISQFNSFLKIIKTWLKPIANYFLERLTSSF